MTLLSIAWRSSYDDDAGTMSWAQLGPTCFSTAIERGRCLFVLLFTLHNANQEVPNINHFDTAAASECTLVNKIR